MAEKKFRGVKNLLKGAFEQNICWSVCLTFFESADARDLGLMTFFELSDHCEIFHPRKYAYWE